MKAYLIRHARAEKRATWDGPDELRGLTRIGWQQAFDLERRLEGLPVARLLSSPYLRCTQTVQPLASARGMTIDPALRLAEGGSGRRALELIERASRWPSVLCSHGDVIPAVLERLRARGLDVDPARCEKGSIWVLEGQRSFTRGTYLPPRAGSGPVPRPLRREHLDPPVRVGVLDLGSTSFHLAVFEARADGELSLCTREREMLRLGSSLAHARAIPRGVVERAVLTARRLGRLAAREGAACLLPVATSAVRDAQNGEALARKLGRAVGAPVRVLSGVEEGRLIFAAVERRLELEGRPLLGADLGGGSLELCGGMGDTLDVEATLPLGVARLHGELVRHDPATPQELAAIRSRVDTLIEPELHRLEALGEATLVATGGTIGALARLLVASPSAPEARVEAGFRVERDALLELRDRLVSLGHDQRLALPGISTRRADLLPTGAVIWARLAERLDRKHLVFSDWGLRAGVALESLGLARLPTPRS